MFAVGIGIGRVCLRTGTFIAGIPSELKFSDVSLFFAL